MGSNIVALQYDMHAHIRLGDIEDYSSYEKEHVIPVVVHEFVEASTDYPVVFVKNAQTGQFQPVILTALKPSGNLFVRQGKWPEGYIPRLIRNQPFGFLPNSHDETQLMMAIDLDRIQGGDSEGERLFDDNGQETDYLKARKQQLIEHFEQNQITEGFVQLILKMDLLVARSLTVDIPEDRITLRGFYFIDENKLNELSDEVFLDLRKRGFLQVIYAHLISLHQINRLANLAMARKNMA